jgi:hypothetical protein
MGFHRPLNPNPILNLVHELSQQALPFGLVHHLSEDIRQVGRCPFLGNTELRVDRDLVRFVSTLSIAACG